MKDRHLETFLATIDKAFAGDPLDDTAEAVAAVFSLLTDRISAGEIEDVRRSLPAALRALWPTKQGEERVRARV